MISTSEILKVYGVDPMDYPEEAIQDELKYKAVLPCPDRAAIFDQLSKDTGNGFDDPNAQGLIHQDLLELNHTLSLINTTLKTIANCLK